MEQIMKTFVLIVVIGGQNISGYLSIKNFKSYKDCTKVINYVKDKKVIKLLGVKLKPEYMRCKKV
jgi:hypothetical protein|tara:strand:+ start:165 stop:359 length:195 start_codon:yes stop_codon:yes gene_type:complete